MTKQKSHASHTEEKRASGLFMRLFFGIPPEYKAQFKAQRLASNVGRMYYFALYIIAVQIILNVINMLKPSDSKSSDINIYVGLSMLLLSIGIVYFILFSRTRKGKIKNSRVKSFLVESLLYLYLTVQLVFCTLNIIATGGINSYIIAILILGMVPIIPPPQSIISVLASFAYLLLAMYFTRNISDAWDSILITDTWANLIIITGITIFMSIFLYDMYVSNFLKSIRLEKSNEDILRANADLAGANHKLELAAHTDQMTGVLNRRAFSHDFGEKMHLSSENDYKIAVALIDIDFFKAYNDKFGHLEGDTCLRSVAESLRQSFRRKQDMVYRFGGEEFLIVFDARENDAYELVERARKNVEALGIPHANTSISPYVTISAGVCVTPPSKSIFTDSAIKIADDALYESKRQGRNQTILREYFDETSIG